MGLLQSDVGYGRGDGETRLTRYGKAVTFLSLADAEAALAAADASGFRVTLLSAPDAAASVGPGWFDAVITMAENQYPQAVYDAILDCGDAPGDAMAALRHGVTHIRYEGARQAAIEDIARQLGAEVVRERPPSLDLAAAKSEGADARAACLAWLRG